MIPAHDSPLAALAFDASGTKLATASEKVRRLRANSESRQLVHCSSHSPAPRAVSVPTAHSQAHVPAATRA